VAITDADISQIRARLAELERKVDHLFRFATDVPPLPAATSDLSPRVQELAAAGNLIGAIKAYREETGVDLATAKAAVEAELG
jgi:ribosomal protein L7/L12